MQTIADSSQISHHPAGISSCRVCPTGVQHDSYTADQRVCDTCSKAAVEFPMVSAAAADAARPLSPFEQRVHARIALNTETVKGGQARLALKQLPRQPHPTGLQVLCIVCARRGVDRLGLPRDQTGDPLCRPCWTTRQQKERQRAVRELEALAWEQASEAAEAVACEACGEPEPTLDCWLCSYTWIHQAKREYELEKLAADAEVEAQFERTAAITKAQARVDDVQKTIEWIRLAVEDYPRGGRRARLVELVAEGIARRMAERTTARGRPAEAELRVMALGVLDADPRAGRRSMPGRARAAWLCQCTERTVSNTWKRNEQLGFAVRTRQGRKLSYAERVELHRFNDRAEFDHAPLHRSPITAEQRAAYVPLALAVVADLLDTLASVLQAAQDELDRLRAESGTWTDWAERAQRAELRKAVARTISTITIPPPAHDIDRNNFPPRLASKGEYLSSCYQWGLSFSRPTMIHTGGNGRPNGRRKIGASRASTRTNQADLESSGPAGQKPRSHPVGRPRTLQKVRPPSPKRPADWVDWAPDLARELRLLWPWLAGVPLLWVAATLGAALGPDWTAAGLVAWIQRVRDRAVLAGPARPAAYLKALLAEALCGEQEPPHPARLTQRTKQAAAVALQVRQHAMLAQARAGQPTARTTPSGQAAELFARLGLRTGRQRATAAADSVEWPPVAPIPHPGEQS